MASNIPVIVQGNSFSLAIPLQIYYINGDQMDLQDYTPDPTDEVTVQLKGSRRNYTYTPTIDGNVANIDLTGNELADNYSVVVSIVKDNGQRLRSFRTDQFFIVESSDDLTTDDIIQGLEENVIYLNSSIFVAGEDGRGIEGIQKTGTSGLVDTYTIYYTDNTTSTFQVTNGANGQAGAQGADGVGITSIEKTGTSGLVDTYTITLSNGEASTFDVTNGKDGVDLGLATIVNDLTTGGATDVLSAEMGKKLNEEARLPLQPLLRAASTATLERFLSIIKAYYKSYQTATVGSVWTPTPTSGNDMVCTKFAVKAGDVVSIWGQGSGTASIYVLVDSEDKVVARGTGGTAITPPQYTEESPVVVNVANDGIIYVSSKSNVDNGATIERVVSPSLVIEPLVGIIDTPRTDTIDVTLDLINYKYQSYNTAAVGSVWAPSPTSASDTQCTKVAVKAGDIVSIWGKGSGTASICILVDGEDKVVLRGDGGNGVAATAYTEENPYKINVDADGLLYLNSLKSVDNGATIERNVEGYIIANPNNDGVMSKEQASQLQGLVEGGSGLAGKLVATIGDSFTAPGSWQAKMNTILATTSYNVAKSGGRWASTDPTTDAYRQATKLVTDFTNVERKPDYILCVLGVNDVNNSVTLGDISYSDTIGSGGIDVTTFTGGMQAVLKTLKDNFATSIIKVGFTPGGMQFLATSSTVTSRMETYIDRMKEVATLYGVGYIETRATGMCRIVASEYNAYATSAGDAHPNAAGQQRIGEYMARILLSNL